MNTVLEQIQKYSIETPEKLAVVFDKEELTYRKLWSDTLKVASFLKANGITKSDRVVAKSLFSKWFVSLCYATWLCGGIFVPADAQTTDENLLKVKNELDAKFVFSEFKDFENCNECTDYEFPAMDDFANIMFTTGTTGNPKGAIWTHKSIYANCLSRYEMFGFNSSSVDLSFVPLNHAAPLWKLYALHNTGATCILLNGMFSLGMIYKFIGKYGVTSMYTSPSGISVIQNLAPEIFTDYSKQIKTLSIGSSALNEAQKEFILKALPQTETLFVYAASESGADSYILLKEQKNIACVGKLCKGVEVRIVDSEFKEVPAGQTGTLLIKSNMVFAGYWNNPELTEKAFYNGYYVSSDVGYFDNNGYLNIAGRNDDVINIGGLKVYPSEVENAALKIAGVSECICFAVEDKITKHASCLLVKEGNVSVSEIRTQLSEMLDSYKIPKFIELTHAIEKTANGKPNRKKAAQIWQESVLRK